MRKKITAKPKCVPETFRANAKVNKEIWDKINEIAVDLGLTPSSVVRVCIIRGLEVFDE
jgi:hypothetical protein